MFYRLGEHLTFNIRKMDADVYEITTMVRYSDMTAMFGQEFGLKDTQAINDFIDGLIDTY